MNYIIKESLFQYRLQLYHYLSQKNADTILTTNFSHRLNSSSKGFFSQIAVCCIWLLNKLMKFSSTVTSFSSQIFTSCQRKYWGSQKTRSYFRKGFDPFVTPMMFYQDWSNHANQIISLLFIS